MHKTTVYLPEAEALRLRQLAASTGRSQADLIREGIHRVLREAPDRRFHSMAKGRSSGESVEGWAPDELYKKVFGRDE